MGANEATNRVGTEATLQECRDLLGVLVKKEVSTFDDFRTIKQIVQAGNAPQVFSIGDQIPLKWNDGMKEYDLPFDVVHFGTVKRKRDGQVVPGMFLQSHWVTPGIQFDGNEAFWYCTEALSAGTYNITMGNNWGTYVVANKTYQFTLPSGVPVGGQLVFGLANSTTGALPDKDPSEWRVLVYDAQTDLDPRERLEVTEGSAGTSLGTLSSSTKYADTGVNNMQRAAYGYNRWSQSGVRQYLNSDGAAETWWTPQNPFDRPCDQLKTMRGFMAGFDSAFLDILEPIEVVTALNTVSDSQIGTTESTWDTFFLPGIQQEYIVPQLADVEGEAWEYWKQRLGTATPQASGAQNALEEHIRYAVENHTSAQNVRLRSASRSYAYHAWLVHSSGHAGSTYVATNASRLAPACVIC